jgi:tryptophan synthase alpha chain
MLSDRFALLRRENRKALVVYVTAGHPDPESCANLLPGLEAAGADVIEIGIPFSDPLADGPVIQRSSQIALAHGTTFNTALGLIQAARLSIPVVIMSYLNTILAAGADVLERAASAGAHGILATDLPVGADPSREQWLASGPLAFVRLVAPTTPTERMREIAVSGSGFVYLISRLGVTGERDRLPADLPDSVARLRGVCELPICVGFGIGRPEQAREAGVLADGVVVGSAVVRAAEESGVASAASLVRKMRAALDSPPAH